MSSIAGQSAKLQTKLQTHMIPVNHQFSPLSCTIIFYLCFPPKALESLGVFSSQNLKIIYSLKSIHFNNCLSSYILMTEKQPNITENMTMTRN